MATRSEPSTISLLIPAPSYGMVYERITINPIQSGQGVPSCSLRKTQTARPSNTRCPSVHKLGTSRKVITVTIRSSQDDLVMESRRRHWHSGCLRSWCSNWKIRNPRGRRRRRSVSSWMDNGRLTPRRIRNWRRLGNGRRFRDCLCNTGLGLLQHEMGFSFSVPPQSPMCPQGGNSPFQFGFQLCVYLHDAQIYGYTPIPEAFQD